MRSACVVRTRFILNNFSGIGLGGSQDPQDPPLGYAPATHIPPVSMSWKCPCLMCNARTPHGRIALSFSVFFSSCCLNVSSLRTGLAGAFFPIAEPVDSATDASVGRARSEPPPETARAWVCFPAPSALIRPEGAIVCLVAGVFTGFITDIPRVFFRPHERRTDEKLTNNFFIHTTASTPASFQVSNHSGKQLAT